MQPLDDDITVTACTCPQHPTPAAPLPPPVQQDIDRFPVNWTELRARITERNAHGWRLTHVIAHPYNPKQLLLTWEKVAPPEGGGVGLTPEALTWLASSPDPQVAAQATALITAALNRSTP